MKRFFKYILAFAAVSFAANACVEEEPFQPGESEEAGCYGVYFPAQETSLVLDPADPTAYTITVARTNTNDNIKVPYVFTSSSEDVFKTGDIEFEDGQSETELSLVFDAAEVGQTYTCSFQIADSKYASKYSSNPANLDFSVIRERWNELGAVTFEEYIMWEFGVPSDSKYAAIIYQSDTDHNIFRVENPFAKRYTNFTDGSDWFTFKVLKPGDVLYKGNTSGYETKITENNLVYFSDFNTGYTNSNYGAKILLCHPSGFNNYKAKEESWKVSRVLQWQDNGLPAAVQIGCYYYMNGIGGWDYSQEPCLLFVFPGAVLTDYTFEVEAGITEDGELPLYFELGADVDVVKYAIYEGNLNSAQVSNHVEAIISGEDKSSEVSEDSEVRVTLGETGIYTLVAVSFDQDGKAQESNSIVFKYVAKGDSREVAVSCGLSSAAKYIPQGISTDSAVEYYVFGTDLTGVKMELFKKTDLVGNMNGCIKKLYESEFIDEEYVDVINNGGLIDVFTNLIPGTEYYLLVYATNGYEESVIISNSETTTGDPLPIYQNYDDIDVDLIPESRSGFYGTYNQYAIDPEGALGLREFMSKVTISDGGEEEDEKEGTLEYVKVKGMFADAAEYLGFDDTMYMEYYGGFLYTLGTVFGPSAANPDWYIAFRQGLDLGWLGAGADYQQVAGFVSDGYLYFFSNNNNYPNLNKMGLFIYSDDTYSSSLGYWEIHEDVLLVDATKDNNGVAPASQNAASIQRALHEAAQTLPANCVETERGRMHSIIDAAIKSDSVKSCGKRAGMKNIPVVKKPVAFAVASNQPFKAKKEFTETGLLRNLDRYCK